ncbi:MAG: hypothetical protein ACK56I_15990, partial [bacterium]
MGSECRAHGIRARARLAAHGLGRGLARGDVLGVLERRRVDHDVGERRLEAGERRERGAVQGGT